MINNNVNNENNNQNNPENKLEDISPIQLVEQENKLNIIKISLKPI